jgi:galactose oxidase
MARDKIGEWGKSFDLLNVPVHASLLPTGKVLYWGRRWTFDSPSPIVTLAMINTQSMDQHATKSFLWDPPRAGETTSSTTKSKTTATQPKDGNNADVNLFCSGHSFQPDGSLLVVGGHLRDTEGVQQACVYNPYKDEWSALPKINNGRWYPSALTLSDGSTLSISGSFFVNEDRTGRHVTTNMQPQIWRNNAWVNIGSPPQLINYPRLHLNPKGGAFMAGPQATSSFLRQDGTWEPSGLPRTAREREFAPSVSYDRGKIIFIGGGNDQGSDEPTNITEIIDLDQAPQDRKWNLAKPLSIKRRQHNATVLPDGTVLVTGGTKGPGFSNIDAGNPVKTPELWTPPTNTSPPFNDTWTSMADASEDQRCYHSIALLLPDGQVISAGSGEGANNPPVISAQLFRPPYLCKGVQQPTLVTAPVDIEFDQKTFDVTVGADDVIKKASWIRIGSVTHANNMSQTFMWLPCKQQGSKVTVDAPDNKNLTPPGHYMLFLLNEKNVPSRPSYVDKVIDGLTIKDAPNNIICLKRPKATPSDGRTAQPVFHTLRRSVATDDRSHDLPALNEEIINEQDRPAVVVGLTPVCPYGLGACWGGAYDALQQITDVDVVRPLPNQPDSVAFVYLKQDVLPDIDVWRKEFAKTANASYHMRGIEMTLSGAVTMKSGGATEQLTLAGTSTRPEVTLAPFHQSSKIQYDMWAKIPREMSGAEADAYKQLCSAVKSKRTGLTVQVTGRLHKGNNGGYSLDVRSWEAKDVGSVSSRL